MAFKKYLGIAIVVTILLTIIYAIFRVSINNGWITESGFWVTLKKWGLIVIIALFGLLILAYLIYWLKRKKKDDEDLPLPKDPVDVDIAREIWKKEFIVKSGIPHYYIYPKDKKEEPIVRLCDERDLVLHNSQGFDREMTGNNWYKFEALTKKGMYQGLNTVQMRIDKGKDYIKNNCFFWIRENTPLEMLKADKDFPIDSIQDQQQRIDVMMYKLREEEDYTERELKYLERMKARPSGIKENIDLSIDPEKLEAERLSLQLKNEKLIEDIKKARES